MSFTIRLDENALLEKSNYSAVYKSRNVNDLRIGRRFIEIELDISTTEYSDYAQMLSRRLQ